MLRSFVTQSTRFRPYLNKEQKLRVEEDVSQKALEALYGFYQELEQFCAKDETFPYDIPLEMKQLSKTLFGTIMDDVNAHLKNFEALLENMLNAHPSAGHR